MACTCGSVRATAASSTAFRCPCSFRIACALTHLCLAGAGNAGEEEGGGSEGTRFLSSCPVVILALCSKNDDRTPCDAQYFSMHKVDDGQGQTHL